MQSSALKDTTILKKINNVELAHKVALNALIQHFVIIVRKSIF
jgi:hypothetical protein